VRKTIKQKALILPHLLAPTTIPLLPKIPFIVSIIKSLTKRIMAIQIGIILSQANKIKTVLIRILSAILSTNFPKVVTWLYFLAM
jgi:hypothetical protein